MGERDPHATPTTAEQPAGGRQADTSPGPAPGSPSNAVLPPHVAAYTPRNPPPRAATKKHPRKGARKPGRQYHRVLDTALTASVLKAFLAADGMEAAPWVAAGESDAVTAALRDDVERATSGVVALQRTWDDMEERIWGTEGAGGLKMTSTQQSDALARQAALGARLTQAREELKIARLRLAEETHDDYLSVREIDAVVAGLQDPRSTEFRNALVRGVRDLAFATEPAHHRSLVGTRLSWTGIFVFETALGLHQVPFGGHADLGAAVTAPPRSLTVLRAMRHQGTPVWTADYWPSLDRGLVADLLGVDPRHFAVGSCPDPDLVRLWMTISHPDPAPGERRGDVPSLEDLRGDQGLRARFGDLDALIAHMQAMHLAGTQRWRFRRSVIEFEQVVAAWTRQSDMPPASPDTDVTTAQRYVTRKLRGIVAGTARAERWGPLREKVTPRLAPCRWCGSLRAGVAEFDEVQGYLCLGCRRDHAGVLWDHGFDAWIAFADRWADHGVKMHPTAVPDVTGTEAVRRH